MISASRMRHGQSNAAIYKTWQGMRRRCFSPSAPFYSRYGGRGITVCARWRDSFANFYADMGPRPSPKHSIERIDNNGNYEPGNCRWATMLEQAQNNTHTRLFTIGDETKTLRQWVGDAAGRFHLVHDRLKRGWTLEEALALPALRGGCHGRTKFARPQPSNLTSAPALPGKESA